MCPQTQAPSSVQNCAVTARPWASASAGARSASCISSGAWRICRRARSELQAARRESVRQRRGHTATLSRGHHTVCCVLFLRSCCQSAWASLGGGDRRPPPGAACQRGEGGSRAPGCADSVGFPSGVSFCAAQAATPSVLGPPQTRHTAALRWVAGTDPHLERVNPQTRLVQVVHQVHGCARATDKRRVDLGHEANRFHSPRGRYQLRQGASRGPGKP